MCTAALLPTTAGGLLLAGNRDELRSRERARPPVVSRHGDRQLLAPVDGQSGGTWIGATDAGLVFALLNLYEGVSPVAPEQARTRGEVIPALAAAANLAQAADLLRARAADLRQMRPFEVAVAAPGGGETAAAALIGRWDGVDLTVQPLPLPALLVSAALDPVGARRARHEEIGPLLAAVAQPPGPVRDGAVQAWFARHDPGTGPRAVCMHRPEAESVSFTLVEVTADASRLRYHDGSPCRPAPVVQSRLPRR